MGGKGSGRFKPGDPAAYNPGSAITQSNAALVDSDQNSRLMGLGKELMSMEPVDMGDADAVGARIGEYLDLCDRFGVRPLVNGMAMALGIGRSAMREIALGARTSINGVKLTPKSVGLVKKAFDFLEVTWEGLLTAEKGSPVKWFFLGKNHFGYKDQTETVHVHEDPLRGLSSAEEVAEKYAAQLGAPPAPLEIEGEVE